MSKYSFLLKIFAVSFLFNVFCLNDKSIAKAETTDFDVRIEFRGFVYGEVLVKGLEWRFSSMIANHSDSSLYCNFKAYFSTDEYFDESDTMIIDKDYYLGANNEVFKEEYFTLDRESTIEEGIYYLIVNIDENQSLPDVQRDNNTFIVPMIIEDNPTDLFPVDLEVSSVNINTTDNIQFDYSLTNTSKYTINYVEHAVYISNDSILDYDEDIVLLNDSRSLIANGRHFEWTKTIPEGLGVGDYYLIIDLDKDSVIVETNEENNQLFKQFQIFEEPVECDIEIRKEGIYPKRVFAGEQIYMDFDITNSGNITTWVDVYAYISTDSLLGNDTYLYHDRNVFSPGREITNIFSYDHVYIPNYITPGHYNILCTVESSEENGTLDNNLIIYPIDVITELDTDVTPDFEILDLNLSDSIVYIDDYISYDFSYCNNSEGEISQEIASISFLSTDSILDDGDIQFEGSRYVKSPRKNDTINSYSLVYTSLDILPGDYYLIFKIDGNNIVSEIDEDNNLFVHKATFKEKPRDISLRLNSNDNRLIFENSFIKDVLYELNFSVLSDDIIEGDSILISYVLSDTLAITENSQELDSDTIIFRSYERPKLKIPASVLPGKYFLKIEASTIKNYIDDNLADNYAWISAYIFENNIDLQLDTLTNQQKSVFSYQLFEVNVNYSNLSNNYIDEAKIRFYLSEDTILDSETDMFLSELMNINLTCFDKKSETVELSSQTELPSGYYYIISSISYKNNFEEENQFNNTAYDSIFIKPNLGDLKFSSVEPNSDTLVQGQNLMGRINIYNGGNRYIDESYLYIFISEDDLLDDSDVFLDSSYCGGLLANKLDLVGFDIDIPGDFTIGNDYLLFSLDHNNIVKEVSDTNNIEAYPVYLEKAFIDVYIDSVDIVSKNIGQGLTIEQNYRVGNAGNTMIDVGKLKVYLSKDTILEKLDDALLNEQFLDYLQPGLLADKTIKINIPSSYDTGEAYLIFDVTIVENELQDSVIDNNRYIAEILIGEAYHDLAGQWSDNNDTSLLEGNSQIMRYAIINNGNVDEKEFEINIYFSSDTLADDGDTLILDSGTNGIIYGGSQQSSSFFFRAPYGLSGDYYLILDIVSDNDLAMENTVHQKIQLIDGYLDYSLKLLECPRIVDTKYEYFFIRVELENNGDVIIHSPQLKVYFSTDSIFDKSDYLAREYTHSQISTLFNTQVQLDLVIPEDYENFNYILLVADPNNTIQEEDEENNIEYFAFNFVSDNTQGNIQFQNVNFTSDSTSNYTLDYTINKDKYIELDTIQIQVSWCSDTINPVKNLLYVDSIFNWSNKILSGQIAIDSNLISDAEAIYLCVEILQNDYDTVYSNNVQYIQLKSSTGVYPKNKFDIQIFPNPVENELHVSSDLPIEEIRIFNLKGALIQILKVNHSNQVDVYLNELIQGEYIIKILSEGKSISKKIIKTK